LTQDDLFGPRTGGELPPRTQGHLEDWTEGSTGRAAPLAARMRPRSLDEFRGQRHILDPGHSLRAMLDRGTLSSMIFWGPPGCGKTTLARLLAASVDAKFEAVSAVTAGVARIREVTGQARERLLRTGRSTILFCDEIHRFNKAQQDSFLPHVEEGTIILIGATTENPSFEVVRPLLSRAPVVVLEPLEADDLEALLVEALEDAERGLGKRHLDVDAEALRFIAEAADGDARRALGVLENAAVLSDGRITLEVMREALQHRFAVYDKSGEEHYNLISALHKSIRGSDPDGALYWLARMLAAGEDPLYVARRLVRMASEDIGLADPAALGVVIAAREAFRFLGAPEGELALAEAALYLATAPKSNRAYVAWKDALDSARETPSLPVPLHLRNAPTQLMDELGYGRGYEYDPDLPRGVSAQRYLPDRLGGVRFYQPGPSGAEREIEKRLRAWERARQQTEAEAGERESDTVSRGIADDSGSEV
jgi:putative ATPase